MKIFQGKLPPEGALHRPKATLGTFDGVHLGHEFVLRQLLTWARASGSDAVVITFDRKPRRVLTGTSPGQILSLRHRLVLFERIGLDAAIVLKFDKALAAIEPEDFVRTLLVQQLRVSGVLLGHDTRFGRDGRGDFELMSRLGRELGFEACSVPVVEVDGKPVSSTWLREAIRSGDLRQSERLLGRRVSVFGTVVHGSGRGKDLGFPTANIDLHHEIHPPPGVYVTRTLVEGVWRDSVTNIGRPPSLAPTGPEHTSRRLVVETHILDFCGNLYGQELEVQFLEFLRNEEVFRSPEALAHQIALDVKEARVRLRNIEPLARAGESRGAGETASSARPAPVGEA